MRIRIVLDANIFASALMKPESSPAKLINIIINSPNYELVLSQPILNELKRVVLYPKVRKRILKLDSEIDQFFDALTICAFFVTQRHTYEVLVDEDPDDDIYLIAALESKAQFLITGDNHLLKLKKIENVQILMALEILKYLK